MSWGEIKYALNNSLGRSNFQPINILNIINALSSNLTPKSISNAFSGASDLECLGMVINEAYETNCEYLNTIGTISALCEDESILNKWFTQYDEYKRINQALIDADFTWKHILHESTAALKILMQNEGIRTYAMHIRSSDIAKNERAICEMLSVLCSASKIHTNYLSFSSIAEDITLLINNSACLNLINDYKLDGFINSLLTGDNKDLIFNNLINFTAYPSILDYIFTNSNMNLIAASAVSLTSICKDDVLAIRFNNVCIPNSDFDFILLATLSNPDYFTKTSYSTSINNNEFTAVGNYFYGNASSSVSGNIIGLGGKSRALTRQDTYSYNSNVVVARSVTFSRINDSASVYRYTAKK